MANRNFGTIENRTKTVVEPFLPCERDVEVIPFWTSLSVNHGFCYTLLDVSCHHDVDPKNEMSTENISRFMGNAKGHLHFYRTGSFIVQLIHSSMAYLFGFSASISYD